VVVDEATCVILPVKAFARGKTRLRDALSDHARETLARAMFSRALQAALTCPRVAAVYVISNGDDVAELVHATDTRRRAVVLRDPDASMTLAALMDWALREAAQRGMRRGLVLMADLPTIEEHDIAALCDALDRCDCVIVSDRRGLSTNGLGLRLPFRGRTAFGQPDSFARHCAHARALGLELEVLANGHIAHDVDIADDLFATAGTTASLDETTGVSPASIRAGRTQA
jgi:2-phospho-L-lactate/phosphoenolpyruvate guanylyltransferase